MKKAVVILCLIIVSGCNVDKASKAEKDEVKTNWSHQKREQYLSNRNDSAAWDNQMFSNDKQLIGIGELGPFELGVFPVPKYELLGADSFKGLGNKSGDFQIGDKTIIMNSFFVGKNELNKARLNDRTDDLFFQILVLTDTLDTENYNLNKSIAISRNHPDYLGQGFVKTKTQTIDYVAFTTVENTAYAIVNTRLFDLNFGKTILIAPQTDGTLKSLQIKSPDLTSNSVMEYTFTLKNKPKIIKFFNNKETI